MQNTITIEDNTPLSQSVLWQYQRDYFAEQGINAWVNQVPFYVTSNPYIANAYADMVFAFIRDWCQQHPGAKQHPFYLLELGTGPGRFSFYVLKRLQQLCHDFAMTDVQLCYVMSDFTANNIDFWRQQPAINGYYEQGLIDFAIYDMEQDSEIRLHRRGVVLSPEILKNPLVVFANYIFDTISHDCFYAHNGQLFAANIKLTTTNPDYATDKLQAGDDLHADYQLELIEGDHYYNDPAIDAALFNYQNKLKNSYFLFPIATLRALNQLRTIANDHLVVISSDKAYGALSELDYHDKPQISFHGSFSLMVNYHAISQYFAHLQGDSVMQFPRRGIKTMMFTQGVNLTRMHQLRHTAEQYIQGVSPADYFVLHRRISETYEECELHTIASHLSFSGWDPHIFTKLVHRICAIIEDAETVTINYLAENMVNIANNFYYMPNTADTPFDIALFFHSMKAYAKALNYYDKSIYYFGKQYNVLYNMALCYYELGDVDATLNALQEAHRIDPSANEASELLDFITKEKVASQ